MKTSKKILEAFEEFRPHISGHGSAINKFLEGLLEVERMEDQEMHAAAKIGWLDYPEHIPEEEAPLVVWNGKRVTDDVYFLAEEGEFRVHAFGYDFDSYKVENVTKFMYLQNLKP